MTVHDYQNELGEHGTLTAALNIAVLKESIDGLTLYADTRLYFTSPWYPKRSLWYCLTHRGIFDICSLVEAGASVE